MNRGSSRRYNPQNQRPSVKSKRAASRRSMTTNSTLTRTTSSQNRSSTRRESSSSRTRITRASDNRDQRIQSRTQQRSFGKGAAGSVGSTLFNLASQFPKIAIIVCIVVVLLLVGLIDTAVNSGKAYGGVRIGAVDVGGMNEEEIRNTLQQNYGENVKAAEITLQADPSSYAAAQKDADSAEDSFQDSTEISDGTSFAAAESLNYLQIPTSDTTSNSGELSVENEVASRAAAGIWTASAASTGATLPYDQAIQEALSAGREGFGPLSRLGVMLSGKEIPFDLTFDEFKLNEMYNEIDKAVGDERIDTTIEVTEEGPQVVKGHDGMMINREAITNELASRMLSSDQNKATLQIQAVDAPSRTTIEQAQDACTAVSRAIANGAILTYNNKSWTADSASLGTWISTETVSKDDGFEIKLYIDPDKSSKDIIGNLSYKADTSDLVVEFEQIGDDFLVHPSGNVVLPDVSGAISSLNDALFGERGKAWSGDDSTPEISVQDTSTPSNLTVNQALDLGMITAIGHYKTDYANEEGTENRNRNIHLVADILDGAIVKANGGIWSFNDSSGDTNQDPPFSSAGSIVNGEIVDSIGGGICQVATTIFNAAYEAGLEIPERYNHTLYMYNYPDGRDAAVSYPDLDFKFKNTLVSDILLRLSYTEDTVSAYLYSVPTGYSVSTQTGEWEEGEKYQTVFETDDALEQGYYYLKTAGADGSKISLVRTVTDKAGNQISADTFASVYQPRDEIYVIGPGTDTSPLRRTDTEDANNDTSYDDFSESNYDWNQGYVESTDGGDTYEYDFSYDYETY